MKPLLLYILLSLPVLASAEEEPIPAPDWATPVPPTKRESFNLPSIQEIALANALKVSLLPLNHLPVFSMDIHIRRQEGRPGIAGMESALLSEGTKFHDGKAFDHLTEKLGISLDFDVDHDVIVIKLSGMMDVIDQAVALVAEALRQPLLAQEDLDRTLTASLSKYKQSLLSPDAAAARRVNQRIFEGHPYGRYATDDDLKTITRDDLINYHAKTFIPSATHIAVAGDMNLEQVKALAEKHFGSWTDPVSVKTQPVSAGTVAEIKAKAVAEIGNQIDLIDLPDTSVKDRKVVILVGLRAIPRNHPDYYPLKVMNTILGGGDEGRLYQNLRERRQWTYGSYSSFGPGAKGGSIIIQTKARPQFVANSISEILVELGRLRDEVVSDEDLQKAKDSIEGGIVTGVETVQSLSEIIAQLATKNIPKEELPLLRERVLAVTAADVQRVARVYLRPDKAAIVVAGSAAEVRADLEKIMPVRMINPDGSPVPGV